MQALGFSLNWHLILTLKLILYSFHFSLGMAVRVMDVFEAVQQRRSIRAYKDTAVPRDKLARILEAARLAPSARNVEPWHFIIVTDVAKKKALSEGLFAGFLSQAPIVIVACGDKKASPDWYMVDVALAVENMVLTATSEGLGTCLVGSFDEKKVRSLLDVHDNFEVLVMLAVGYALEKLDLSSKVLRLVRRRKILSEIVSEEEFGRQTKL